MRSFWITIILVICFLTGWFVLHSYTEANVKSLDGKLAIIDDEVLNENWDYAYDLLGQALTQWVEFNGKIAFTLDKNDILDIEDGFKRSQKYILAKDNSNSSGEVRSLQVLLEKLVRFQEPTFDNIF